MTSAKLEQLRDNLKHEQLEAILITSSINRQYMTGFTGTAGTVIITQNDALLLTDFRYIDQATDQAPAYTIVKQKHSMEKTINEQLKALNVQQLGFEPDHITYAQYKRYQEALSVELTPASGLVEQLRLIKSDEELAIMQKAADIAEAAFEHIKGYIKPGVKEIDVSNELEFFMRRQGATASSFDTIVASGERAALPHGVASEKVIQSGELVTLDFGALYNGYCSDMTRTLAVGEVSDELQHIYETVLEAQLKGVNGLKPGMTGKEADALTRDYIKAQGYGDRFGHSTGHGVGMEVHEGPSLSYRSDKQLEPGMVVTVEPGIYVPGLGGCRIEDDLVITESGSQRLTTSSKAFTQL